MSDGPIPGFSWKKIESKAAQVGESYLAFLKSSDDLAEILGYDDEYVLRRCIPVGSDNRRCLTTALDWVNENRDKIIEHYREYKTRIESESKKRELLKSLNLSDEQKSLLGIK